MSYTWKSNFTAANKENSLCRSCSKSDQNHPMYGKNPNIETRKKQSKSHTGKHKGKNNCMFGKIGKNNPKNGKSNYDFWIEKYGKEIADQKQEETKRKMRLSAIKRIEKRIGQISPNYNPQGCKIIDWFNMYYEFDFQHAENGGEICIDGYFPDGVDQNQMIIIEIDEKHHFNNGNLNQKDIDRQKYLENLGYDFMRIKETK